MVITASGKKVFCIREIYFSDTDITDYTVAPREKQHKKQICLSIVGIFTNWGNNKLLVVSQNVVLKQG